MKKIRITAVRKTCCPDLMEQYENLIEHACDVQEGQAWIANGWEKPQGFCGSAWDSISAFVMTRAHGGGNFYDGWMQNNVTPELEPYFQFRFFISAGSRRIRYHWAGIFYH